MLHVQAEDDALAAVRAVAFSDQHHRAFRRGQDLLGHRAGDVPGAVARAVRAQDQQLGTGRTGQQKPGGGVLGLLRRGDDLRVARAGALARLRQQGRRPLGAVVP